MLRLLSNIASDLLVFAGGLLLMPGAARSLYGIRSLLVTVPIAAVGLLIVIVGMMIRR